MFSLPIDKQHPIVVAANFPSHPSRLFPFLRSPALFAVKARRVTNLSLYQLHAQVPFSLTIMESRSLSVAFSTFETVHWPGFYVYNVTKAAITHSKFYDVAPKTVVAQKGKWTGF